MTFNEIVDRIAERLNIPATALDSRARIGRLVNDVYREVTTSIGIDLSRRVAALAAPTSLGIPTITFTGVEKLERVYDDTSGSIRMLPEVTYDQLRDINPAASDTIRKWAVESWTSTTVTIRIDALPQTVFNLKADGYIVVSTLTGSDEPAFPESFHDALVDGVLVEEYLKKQQIQLSDRAAGKYEKRISDLRMWRAKSIGAQIRQNEAGSSRFGVGGTSGGGGSAISGGTSWTQSGLITFDRDPDAPFAVSSGSAMVDNLDANFLQGLTVADIITAVGGIQGPASSTDNAIVRFNGSGGDTIQNSGITISDGATGTLSGTNTGDITLAGTHNYLSLAAQVITLNAVNVASHITGRLPYANLVQSTTGSKIVGIRSGAGGDWEECSLGAGLSMSNGAVLDTAANATAQTANRVYAGPTSGGAATPTFRSLVVADLPTTGEWLAEDVQVSAGGGTEQFKLGGIIETDDTQASAAGTEVTLYSYSIPANTLNSNGRMVVFRAWGTLAADTDNKIIRVRFDSIAGTIIIVVSQNAAAYTRFEVELRIIRIGSNSQRVIAKAHLMGASNGTSSTQTAAEVTTAAKTDSSAIPIVLTGEGINSNDIVYEASVVEMYN